MCVYLRTKFQVSKQTPKKSTKISVKRFQGNNLLSQLAKLVNIFDKLPDTLFFTSYSTDFGSVANKNIRNMHAVLTNQIKDILYIDDDDASNSLTTLRNP